MERFLAPHEAAVLAGDVRVVLCSEVDGDLNEQTVVAALTHLQTCYPLLAGTFSTKDGRPQIVVNDRPAHVALDHGTSYEEEINAALTWTPGPLLRITLLREPTRTRVVMTLPRAFVDGMSYLALHRRFWAIYAALLANEPVPVEVVEPVLGPALDDLLAARFSQQQLHDFVAQRAQSDADAVPAVLPPLASVNGMPGADQTFRTIAVEVDADRSANLAQYAHDASLSRNALVSAALLTSLRTFLEPATGTVRMLCTTAVDMRRRLQPPIPPEVLQSAATTTSIRLEVDSAATPVDVARELASQLHAAVDSGAAAMELATFEYMIDQHPPTLVITDVGAIAEPVLPDGLDVTGVRLAPLGHLPMIFAVVSRYRQRLDINLAYSRAWFIDSQINDLATRVSTTLNDLAEPTASVTSE
ncbi:hypothetical protein GCM10010174_66710 [Kutzneria viridogrisea]|uniref:Phthiocerol/phthiodiolone dimycocerosyl transferase n=2 Tax=Kutzneria TaxID=43356 RepID=W5WDI0_9PSEU|nr:condensation protein [Kutzneria albida]AHH98820.1 hypothetical protein KALB_5458 [Kutzneria albida DSM 43870]MBA8923660.1 NRPS condensation-like uncharacterized protein [Kutzneria viridogrisea]